MLGYTLLLVARRSFLSADTPAAIWPATGLLAATLLLSPRRLWKWALLIAAGESLVVNAVYGFSWRTLPSIPEGVLLAWLTWRACPPGLNFADPRTLMLFLLKAVIPACLASTAMVALLPGSPNSVAASFHWFVGHALGAAISVPTMVILARRRRFADFRRPAWELTAVSAVVITYITVLFSAHSAVFALLVFPMAMFVAFRYGPVGACTCAVLMTGLALSHIYAGIPAPRAAGYDQIQWTQTFVAIVFLTSLPAAGALSSLRRTEALLGRRTETARRARRRADDAVQAKTRFLATMSHEIRTPLNGVIGLADALSRTRLEPDQREMLDMIQGSGRALNGILSDVLDLARADAGGIQLALEPFDPGEAIAAASYLFASIARDKGLDFEVRLDMRHPGPATGDALRIRQIVSNLISNAVKFTDAGRVSVHAQLRPSRSRTAAVLQVTVSDTGVGFGEEAAGRLFSRFEQADPTIARRFGGTGLGLAISRELAGLMGGRIDCRSIPGQGSTFTLRVPLPLLDAAPSVAAAAPEPFVQPQARRLQVLLAEDHPVNQRVIQAILDDSVALTIVADGQCAVDACRAQAFDLVLMDTQMPVMDGLSAIRAIRAIRAWESRQGRAPTPIISLTADAMPHQVQEALAAGADRHLAKPITAASLLGAMGAALELKAA